MTPDPIDLMTVLAFVALVLWVGHGIGHRRATESGRALVLVLDFENARKRDAIEAQWAYIDRLDAEIGLLEAHVRDAGLPGRDRVSGRRSGPSAN